MANLLACLCLGAAAWSIYLNPSDWWFISFFGLFFLLFLSINIFFVIFWLMARSKLMILSIMAILVSWPVLRTYVSFHLPAKKTDTSSDELRIISYNVRNFDVYQWSKERDALSGIMNLIKREQPDILCMQEFYSRDTGEFNTIRRITRETGLRYYHFEKKQSGPKGQTWGTAIFSRFPIVNHGTVQFDNATQNSCSYADLQVNDSVIRVFNIHLQSVYLSKEDYQYLDDISGNQGMHVKPTRAIFSKLKRAFIYRGEQALNIEQNILTSAHPVIACGDFNDAPASFAYHTLSAHLQDAFLAAGWGISPTYTGFPHFYRIDYIFADESFQISSFKTICENYSDHYPVRTVLKLKK